MTTGEIAEQAYRKAFVESLPPSKAERIAWQAAADAVIVSQKNIVAETMGQFVSEMATNNAKGQALQLLRKMSSQLVSLTAAIDGTANEIERQ